MANSDKNIIITPFVGGVTQPNITFIGQGNDPIYLRVLDGITGTGLTHGGALSVEGSAGQLFSIVNRLGTGSIFSVNDISGIPSLDINANGTVSIAGFTGNVGIGVTTPTRRLTVIGDVAFFGTTTGATGFYWSNSNSRLGIGVTSPNMALDVVGSGEFTGELFVGGPSAGVCAAAFIRVTTVARNWFL